MLDTEFPRPPGDVGHGKSWNMPVLFAIIPGAFAGKVVRGGAGAMVDAFATAGNHLADQGAVGLITSCGFLASMQSELAASCRIPVASSSLLQIPMLQRCVRGRIGVITYDAEALSNAHFTAVGADPATPRVGLPALGEFHALIEHGAPYATAALKHEAVAAATSLVAQNPDIAAIVLECTNLPPFAAAIQAATRLPVYDVITLGHWFYAGLVPRRFSDDL